MAKQAKSKSIDHVAIIMDGNGRWAQARHRPRLWGHVRGTQVVSEIVEEADDLGVKALTLYAFSNENWSRPVFEVTTLFRLLRKFLLKERERILKNKICFRVIGDISSLPGQTINLIRELELETREFQGLKLTFAFGYSSRDEIVQACNRFIRENPSRPIDEQSLTRSLMRPEVSEVDLLIRTGGDQRISNFLLWQIAYAELYFTETKWPDFSRAEFKQILKHVSERERRFGHLGPCESLDYSKKVASQHREVVSSFNSPNSL